jgi:hypothetical protein
LVVALRGKNIGVGGNFKSMSNVYVSERVFRTAGEDPMKQIRVQKGRRPR